MHVDPALGSARKAHCVTTDHLSLTFAALADPMVRRGGGAEFSIGYEIIELVEPELIVLRSDPMPQMGMHEPTVVRV